MGCTQDKITTEPTVAGQVLQQPAFYEDVNQIIETPTPKKTPKKSADLQVDQQPLPIVYENCKEEICGPEVEMKRAAKRSSAMQMHDPVENMANAQGLSKAKSYSLVPTNN